jgi:pimeloyl-ACP methyl ester carboxylesterase
MRITQTIQPDPDIGCVPDGLHPHGYFEAPHRFLQRRPPAYWDQLMDECMIRNGCDPDHPEDCEQEVIDACRVETTPIEDQWVGRLSAFNEGLLIEELREAARTAREDPSEVLADAAAASVDDIELARALADLAVTGRNAFENFRGAVPTVPAIAELLRSRRPALTEEERNNASEWALGRALTVAAALRTGFNRSDLGWIAVSAPDDPPHRPVNVPVTEYPQIDLDVHVQEGVTHEARTVRVRTMIAAGEPPVVVGPPAGMLATDPVPTIDSDSRIILFLHGHSSRLEESESLLYPLTRRGFTVVAMDLPSCGYSEMVAHEELGGATEDRPSGNPGRFAALDFMEQFVVDFIRELGRDIWIQICAIIGGSLGGNLSLRMAKHNALQEPFAANTVPWSAASVWTPASGAREAGPSTASAKAWTPEDDDSRAQYFYDVFTFGPRWLSLRPQPEYWYRDDDWEPCKSLLIKGALADRQEIYNPLFRRWHWRVAMEQLWFSHRLPVENNMRIIGRTLLAAGTEDNYEWSNIHDATRELAVELPNAPGRLVAFGHTGHSIYVERPELLARIIAGFVPPLCPIDGREEIWTDVESLGGYSSSDPTVAVQEDGRLVVFTLSDVNRVQSITESVHRGSWGSWNEINGGLGRADGFLSSIAVGANEAGHLEVFATLTSEPWLAHVWQDGPNGAWGDWDKGNHISQLIGGAANGVAVADRVGDGPSRLLLAIARRVSGRIHIRGQDRLGGWWWNGLDLGGSDVVLVGQPAVAANHRRSLHIVVRDDAGDLQHIWEESPDVWTDDWISFGAVSGDPAIALDSGGRLHVFARGTGGDLLVIRERVSVLSTRGTRGDWGMWTSLGGTIASDARPVVHRNAWGQLQVFVRFTDGSIQSRRQLTDDGTWSNWLRVGGETNRNPAVAMNQDGTLSLFYVDTDGAVQVTRQLNTYVEEALERRVSASRKNSDGDILALCSAGEPWSPRAVDDAIRDIETGAHIYYIEEDGTRVEIHVVDSAAGKYLRSDPDMSETNNLDSLPDC